MDTGSVTAAGIQDLRSALEFLASIPGQLSTTRQPVDPHAELAAVYKRVGASSALLFENVKGFSIPVVAGILASRERTALLVGSTIERLPFDLLDALNHTCAPVTVATAPCQEVVIRPPFDLRRLIPAVTLIVLGIQSVFSSFFMSALGLKTASRKPPALPEDHSAA